MTTDDILIFSYSRKEAIEDGVLIDVTETAREAGFRFPVALTAAAWGACVSVPAGVECQDEKGRLWDVLMMLRHAVRGARGEESTVYFDVLVLNDRTTPKPVRLRAVLGPDDDMSPCVTVMLPEEGPLGGCGVVDRMAAIDIVVDNVAEEVGARPGLAEELLALGGVPGHVVIVIGRTYYASGRAVETADVVVPADRYRVAYHLPVR